MRPALHEHMNCNLTRLTTSGPAGLGRQHTFSRFLNIELSLPLVQAIEESTNDSEQIINLSMDRIRILTLPPNIVIPLPMLHFLHMSLPHDCDKPRTWLINPAMEIGHYFNAHDISVLGHQERQQPLFQQQSVSLTQHYYAHPSIYKRTI